MAGEHWAVHLRVGVAEHSGPDPAASASSIEVFIPTLGHRRALHEARAPLQEEATHTELHSSHPSFPGSGTCSH